MPGFLGTDPDIIFLVDILQEFNIESLVTVLGITKIAQILRDEAGK